MVDYFSIEPQLIKIEQFRQALLSKNLLPSRVSLLENIENRFFQLATSGIVTLDDLLKELKSKVKLQAFSDRTGIDEEYLVLLKREAGSYIPKTVKLDKFPEADQALLQRLHEIGIADSKKLVNQFYNDEKPVRAVYSDFKKSFQYLVELCDLSRIPGVGPAFAYILWRSGYASAEDFLNTPITEVFETSSVFYEELFPKGPVYHIRDLEYAFELSRFMKVQIPIQN